VIDAPELPGVFDGHDFLHVLDDAHYRMVARGIGADGTEFVVGDIVAEAAITDVATQRKEGRGEAFGVFRVATEHVERETEGGLAADARKGGELVYGAF